MRKVENTSINAKKDPIDQAIIESVPLSFTVLIYITNGEGQLLWNQRTDNLTAIGLSEKAKSFETPLDTALRCLDEEFSIIVSPYRFISNGYLKNGITPSGKLTKFIPFTLYLHSDELKIIDLNQNELRNIRMIL